MISKKSNVTHEVNTVGGWYGHVLRRLIHFFCVTFFTLGFYICLPFIQSQTHISKPILVLLIFTLVLAVELIRLMLGIILPGQREHERHKVSSAAWSLLGLCCVFWFINHTGIAMAIAITSAIVDPFVGESQRFLSKSFSYGLALFLSILIWLACAVHFNLSYWYAFILGPIAVMVEYPYWRFLDDNFTMLVAPLIAFKLLQSVLVFEV